MLEIHLFYLFTFSFISKVYKFTSLIWFNSLISFNSPTYSKVQESQWSYLVLHSHLFQKCSKFTSIIWFDGLISFNNSISSTVSQIPFYNLISVISYSTVPHIQQCRKFSCIIYFHSHISFNSPNNIQQCNKFNSIISFTIYLIQQFHIFNSVTNSVVLSNFTVLSYSTVPHIQQCRKFSCIIYFHSHILVNTPTYSTVSQIQLSYLVYILIYFINVTNSLVLFYSTV